MSKEAKIKRLSELYKIPPFARIDHRNMRDINGKTPIEKLPRKERRKLKKASDKIISQYKKIMNSTLGSGAGYPVDDLLHQLAVEYTHRFACSGTNNQPVNFNYFEAFCNIQLIENSFAPYAVPIPEVDTLFGVTDFFEFITSTEMEDFELKSLICIPENKAFHYTTNGDVNDLKFLNASGREFVISGFSLVRRGYSLFWYLLGGEHYLEEEWKALCEEGRNTKFGDLENVPSYKRAFIEDAIRINGAEAGKPLALDGTKTALRKVVAGEIDILSEKYYSRCIMSDYENVFQIQCDDPEIFLNSGTKTESEKRSKLMLKEIEKCTVLWDLAGSMFKLPVYISSRASISKKTVEKSQKSVSKPRNIGGTGLNSKFVNIPAIEVTEKPTSPIIQIAPTYYKTETNGHWRRINPDSQGTGPNGEIVKGRTWVKKKNSWRELDREPKTIYVKSSIEAAKLKIEEYDSAAEAAITENKKDRGESGVLYVLRCTAMQEEVYKVGWTSKSASERARELSRATGVPKSFIVVDYWKHENPHGLEVNVHAMLNPYRINDRREFFSAPYNKIKSIIEIEIHRNSTQ